MANDLSIPGLDARQIEELKLSGRAANSPLLPLAILRDAIPALAGRFTLPTNDDATKISMLLLGSYPRHAVAEPEIYSRAIKSVLLEYPRAVGFAAVDALTRKLKFIPTRAELCEELEHQMQPLREAMASAQWMEREHIKRAKLAAEDAEILAGKERFKAMHGGKSPLEVLGAKFSAEEPDLPSPDK